MAKTGKITIQVADYNHLVHFANLLDVQLLEKSQIGLEVNIVISYKSVQDVYKMALNVGLTKGQVLPAPTNTPSKVATGSKATKK